ncbi:methyltransferase domain-containing protein [Streptomyces sp. CB02923]|uniref:methyltransferase domain-containing protein n=1 Tax=Streptomyces sp. CB02923 TaxID=1718985 RepID=UPI0026CD72C5
MGSASWHHEFSFTHIGLPMSRWPGRTGTDAERATLRPRFSFARPGGCPFHKPPGRTARKPRLPLPHTERTPAHSLLSRRHRLFQRSCFPRRVHQNAWFTRSDQFARLRPGEVFLPSTTHGPALFSRRLPFPRNGAFLEVGCGTGVTAVHAARAGCADVLAVDVEPQAVATTLRNARRHDAPQLRAKAGDVFGALGPRDGPFDLTTSRAPAAGCSWGWEASRTETHCTPSPQHTASGPVSRTAARGNRTTTSNTTCMNWSPPPPIPLEGEPTPTGIQRGLSAAVFAESVRGRRQPSPGAHASFGSRGAFFLRAR